MATKPVMLEGIVGGYDNSDISKVCRSTTVNMYYESQGEQASSKAILRSIQGTSTYLELPEARCRGLFRCSRGARNVPALYACMGSKVYYIEDNAGHPSYTEIGTVSNAYNTQVHMCETGGYGDAHPHLIVVDGASVFAVDTTLLPLQQREDWKAIKLPLRAAESNVYIVPTHCAYLYGRLVINDSGTDSFYVSCQYPFEESTFKEDIFMTSKYGGYGFHVESEWMTDNTTALISNGSHLWTFGPRSYQIFSYNDDLNFPFTSPDNAASAIGLKAPNSLCSVGESVFWLASSDIGENGVYVSNGSSTSRISNHVIEREIQGMTNPSDAIGQCWQENRHTFYALTFITDRKTLVYDIAEAKWHVRASYDNYIKNNDDLWRPQYATFMGSRVLFGTLSDNKLIYLDSTKWTEYDGLVMVRKRRSAVMTNSFSPFYCDALKLVINNGQVSSPTMNPSVSMAFSWDGSSWSNQELGLCGHVGQYDWETVWYSLGYGNILTVEIKCSDNYNFTIINAKICAEAGGLF